MPCVLSEKCFVSLFVRLWVEMYMIRFWEKARSVSLFVRLWVEMLILHLESWFLRVSLFVRLWVEISVNLAFTAHPPVSLFVRLWVEMCCWSWTDMICLVSLFVRLWVEMNMRVKHEQIPNSQPLREAVSWNNGVQQAINADTVSASSWGCELKLDMYLT